MMWPVVLGLLMVITIMMLRLHWYAEQLGNAKRQARREHSLRVATEVAFCEVVEEQIGDRLRSNRRRVSETTARFAKAVGDGREPN